MPIQTIAATGTTYALIALDTDGSERNDDPDAAGGQPGRLSDRLLAQWRGGPAPTDIFLWSHGWQGDIPAARSQYDRWIGAFSACAVDEQEMRALRPGLALAHIGVHWPSLPWGDEELGDTASFAAPAHAGKDAMIDAYAQRLGDTPQMREALAVIVEAARTGADAARLPPEVRQAYLKLDQALALGAGGADGDAGADRLPFDPDASFTEASQLSAAFGAPSLGGILAPLRQLSFWTMKKRAQTVGEQGVHALVNRLLESLPDARVHLMGHSFGCIVMSAALGGPGGTAALRRPVDSCVLVQGAMSLWAYAPSIPVRPDSAGYCHRLLPDGKLRGPLVVTRSRHDTAVCELYPWAAGVAGQVAFEAAQAYPTFGAIGAFGIQGVGTAADTAMLDIDGRYVMPGGRVLNVEASDYICHKSGISGAHNDISGPQVAHLIWQAAQASATEAP
ncbi:hypothetical protein LMG23992_04335 [Cupriavidus laharis]|uniref:Alpha/beta hydrolase n=1 Tax=Cupriavidus laharis TaxID=151654 RepID=A0ABM8XKZ8_9BURK|nr:hypothetical protein [Cupriavidus laharis]CAG9180897.1 hypothetical protein LMG23992_04335 [Cupriavidus laharis]